MCTLGVGRDRRVAPKLSLNSLRGPAPKSTLAFLLPSFGLEDKGVLDELHVRGWVKAPTSYKLSLLSFSHVHGSPTGASKKGSFCPKKQLTCVQGLRTGGKVLCGEYQLPHQEQPPCLPWTVGSPTDSQRPALSTSGILECELEGVT